MKNGRRSEMTEEEQRGEKIDRSRWNRFDGTFEQRLNAQRVQTGRNAKNRFEQIDSFFRQLHLPMPRTKMIQFALKIVEVRQFAVVIDHRASQQTQTQS